MIATRTRRLGWTMLAFVLFACAALWLTWHLAQSTPHLLTTGEIMTRLIALPALGAVLVLALLTGCAATPAVMPAPVEPAAPAGPAKPFMAQMVGVQWLNPLQRRDYSTEWQLLWTLGLVGPNKNDDMVNVLPVGVRSWRWR